MRLFDGFLTPVPNVAERKPGSGAARLLLQCPPLPPAGGADFSPYFRSTS
ncbi:hypothetical protein HMPREF9371_0212 [Neisseria shayeganii 871]|uniref:Uncharacterized protein n=1 Tax=Neisseria shayeganii 871 TaxID=1032488 RepID=G4CF23_9NEIS|nr:hypothetical protein HMPREF9371_0212 [Neisseria shayeganii 871]